MKSQALYKVEAGLRSSYNSRFPSHYTTKKGPLRVCFERSRVIFYVCRVSSQKGSHLTQQHFSQRAEKRYTFLRLCAQVSREKLKAPGSKVHARPQFWSCVRLFGRA
jgi:hypothetical protein